MSNPIIPALAFVKLYKIVASLLLSHGHWPSFNRDFSSISTITILSVGFWGPLIKKNSSLICLSIISIRGNFIRYKVEIKIKIKREIKK